MNLLSKFLLIAKSCYEQRNFATAMQILGGLEHAAVRQCAVSPPRGRAGGPHGARPHPDPAARCHLGAPRCASTGSAEQWGAHHPPSGWGPAASTTCRGPGARA